MPKTLEDRPRTGTRATLARLSSRVRWWRPAFLAITALASLAVLVGSVAGIALYKYADSKIVVITCPPTECPKTPSGPGPTPTPPVSGVCQAVCTYLILGDDSRVGLSKADQSRFGSGKTVPGQRSDTIILVRLDPREKKAIVLSFPRDLWVKIPNQGWGKITSAFQGGPWRTADVVDRLTGLKIDHFMAVSLAGFQHVISAIGGVPICVDRPMFDKLAGLNIPAGCQVLGPEQALAFVRARHVCGDKIPDFSRITRQQQFLRAVLVKILRPTMIFHAGSVIPAVLSNLLVDPGLKSAGIAEMVHLVRELQGVSTGAVDFRVLPSIPATVQTKKGVVDIVKLVQPQASQLLADLREGKPLGSLGLELPLTPPSPADIKVRVFDEGSRGIAANVSGNLAIAGFNVQQPLSPTDSLGVKGPVILYARGALAKANVVRGFLKGLPEQQAAKGALPGLDVAVVIPAGYHGPLAQPAGPSPSPSPSSPVSPQPAGCA